MKHTYATVNGTVRLYDWADAQGKPCYHVSIETRTGNRRPLVSTFDQAHAEGFYDRICRKLRQRQGRIR